MQIYPILMAMPCVPMLRDQLPADKQLFEVFQALRCLKVRAGWVLAVHCTPSAGTGQQQLAEGAWGQTAPGASPMSVSNALCCCAWPADAVPARNYTISVIHTCIISWLCCSWEAADSRKFPRTWEKPNGTDECTETSSATRALGTQHPFPFFSIYEAKTMKLTSWILIFKTLYVLMSLKALGR